MSTVLCVEIRLLFVERWYPLNGSGTGSEEGAKRFTGSLWARATARPAAESLRTCRSSVSPRSDRSWRPAPLARSARCVRTGPCRGRWRWATPAARARTGTGTWTVRCRSGWASARTPASFASPSSCRRPVAKSSRKDLSTPHRHWLLRPRYECKALRSACLYVCLSVCPLAYLKNHTSKLYEIFMYSFFETVARSSADDNAICDVFPVLWMTSSFHIMTHGWMKLALVDK